MVERESQINEEVIDQFAESSLASSNPGSRLVSEESKKDDDSPDGEDAEREH